MRKQDFFKRNKIQHIDYRDVDLLSRFLNQSGKIQPRRRTGLTAENQKDLARAIKRSRFMALMPYIKQ